MPLLLREIQLYVTGVPEKTQEKERSRSDKSVNQSFSFLSVYLILAQRAFCWGSALAHTSTHLFTNGACTTKRNDSKEDDLAIGASASSALYRVVRLSGHGESPKRGVPEPGIAKIRKCIGVRLLLSRNGNKQSRDNHGFASPFRTRQSLGSKWFPELGGGGWSNDG